MSRQQAKTCGEVDRMCTRKLPIKNAGKVDSSIYFLGKKNKTGHWGLFSINKGPIPPKELTLLENTLRAIYKKHLGQSSTEDSMNFDEAFLILRELEETYLKHGAAAPDTEPFDHYMAASRLLPKQFREGLDDLYRTRQPEKEILPSKAPKPN